MFINISANQIGAVTSSLFSRVGSKPVGFRSIKFSLGNSLGRLCYSLMKRQGCQPKSANPSVEVLNPATDLFEDYGVRV